MLTHKSDSVANLADIVRRALALIEQFREQHDIAKSIPEIDEVPVLMRDFLTSLGDDKIKVEHGLVLLTADQKAKLASFVDRLTDRQPKATHNKIWSMPSKLAEITNPEMRREGLGKDEVFNNAKEGIVEQISAFMRSLDTFDLQLRQLFKKVYVVDQPTYLIKLSDNGDAISFSKPNPIQIEALFRDAIACIGEYHEAFKESNVDRMSQYFNRNSHNFASSVTQPEYSDFYAKCAELDNDQERIESYYDQKLQQGITKLVTAAENGHPSAMQCIGYAYLTGEVMLYDAVFKDDFTRDKTKGRAYLSLVAEKTKSKPAAYELAADYWRDGDKDKAVAWANKALDFGSQHSAIFLLEEIAEKTKSGELLHSLADRLVARGELSLAHNYAEKAQTMGYEQAEDLLAEIEKNLQQKRFSY